MKAAGKVIKSTIVTGLFTLLPLLLFILLATEIFQLLVALAAPIAETLFPKDLLEDVGNEVLIALVLLLLTSLLLGLLSRSRIGRKMGGWIEGHTLGRTSLYRAVKRLVQGFADADSSTAIIPGLLNNGHGEQDLVYVIEDHGNGRLTVMLPWAPAAFAGSIKIVDAARVELVNSNIGEYSKVLGQWGLGMPEILARKQGPQNG